MGGAVIRLPQFLALTAFLCIATPVVGQQIRGGIMAGPSWPVGDAGASIDAGFGGEAWVGLELPVLPVMPRAAFGLDRFSNIDQGGDLDTRTGRLDLVVDLRRLPLDPFGFVGVGVTATEYRSFGVEPPPVGIVDAGATFAVGLGAQFGLGPIEGTGEARYLTVPDAEFQVVQLRVGLAF